MKTLNQNKMTAVEWLYQTLWKQNNYSLPSNILEQAKAMEKEQHSETWDVAHQAGRFEGKGIAEENWQTFETHWKENYKSKQDDKTNG
jgi:hypothetical protein